MLDEGLDTGLEVTVQELVLKQYAVRQGLLPVLVLAYTLGLARRAADMVDILRAQILIELTGDVTGTIVAE